MSGTLEVRGERAIAIVIVVVGDPPKWLGG